MTAPEKPRHQSGYTPEDLEQVKSVCLTIAVTLGSFMDDICIVGGLVPALLIDTARTDSDHDRHPGTNDLDVALAVVLLDEERYEEISRRLRAESFAADHGPSGQITRQRWRHTTLKVTIDFLIAPTSKESRPGRLQNLEPDFAAMVMPGLELAFAEKVNIELDGHTLSGDHARRTIPVCGPAAFVVLKALAFGNRGEPKDAFDLVYVIKHSPAGGAAIAAQLASHAELHREIIEKALAVLARDFEAPSDLGPRRAAEFISIDNEDHDANAADAHGYIDDFLRAAQPLGLIPTVP